MKLLVKKRVTQVKPVDKPTAAVNEPGPMSGLIRSPELERLVQLSRSTVYRQMQRGDFPRSLKLSPNAKAWRRDEIEAWIRQRDRS
jgi:prophage regulatory protein